MIVRSNTLLITSRSFSIFSSCGPFTVSSFLVSTALSTGFSGALERTGERRGDILLAVLAFGARDVEVLGGEVAGANVAGVRVVSCSDGGGDSVSIGGEENIDGLRCSCW